MFSIRRATAIAWKEFLHLARDRRMVAVIFLAPLIQLSVLGYAANFDVLHVPAAIVDMDHSPVARTLTQRLGAGEAFDVLGVVDSLGAAEALMDAERAEVVVVVPEGTARRLKRGEPAEIPIWLNGTDTNRAIAARGYAEAAIARTSEEVLGPRPPLPWGIPTARDRVLYNPTLQSRWFMVPGVLAMVLTVVTVLLSGMAIVKERENGTIEQLSVTPIRPAELLAGKLAPFVVVGMIDGLLVCLVAVLWFGVPFRGSPWDLGLMTSLYLVSTLGLGLLVSTISRTQQQAMMSGMLVLLPSLLLAGVMYPVSNMPEWAQTFSRFLPLSYFIQMVRGVFLKGVGVRELAGELLALAGLAAAVLAVAVARFRKRTS